MLNSNGLAIPKKIQTGEVEVEAFTLGNSVKL